MMNEKTKNSLWSITFTAVIAGVLILSFVVSILVAALGKDFSESPAAFFLSYGASGLGLFAAVFFIVKFCKVPANIFYKKTDYRFYFALPFIAAGCFFAFSGVNSAFIEFLGNFGYVPQVTQIPEPTFLSVTLNVILICVVPAVFEEFLFRGIITQGLKKYGKVKALIISALLFTVYHMNAAQTPYQLLLGLVFSFVALFTGSVIPSTVLHFLNNLVVLILCYVVPDFAGFTVTNDLLVVLGGVLLLALSLFYVYKLSKIPSCVLPEVSEIQHDAKTSKKGDNRLIDDLLYLAPGLIVAVSVYIASLF